MKEDSIERVDVLLAKPNLYQNLFGKKRKLQHSESQENESDKPKKVKKSFFQGGKTLKNIFDSYKSEDTEESFLNYDQTENWSKPSQITLQPNKSSYMSCNSLSKFTI